MELTIDDLNVNMEHHSIQAFGELYVPFRFSNYLGGDLSSFQVFLSRAESQKKNKEFEQNTKIGNIELTIFEKAPSDMVLDVDFRIRLSEVAV